MKSKLLCPLYSFIVWIISPTCPPSGVEKQFKKVLASFSASMRLTIDEIKWKANRFDCRHLYDLGNKLVNSNKHLIDLERECQILITLQSLNSLHLHYTYLYIFNSCVIYLIRDSLLRRKTQCKITSLTLLMCLPRFSKWLFPICLRRFPSLIICSFVMCFLCLNLLFDLDLVKSISVPCDYLKGNDKSFLKN